MSGLELRIEIFRAKGALISVISVISVKMFDAFVLSGVNDELRFEQFQWYEFRNIKEMPVHREKFYIVMNGYRGDDRIGQ